MGSKQAAPAGAPTPSQENSSKGVYASYVPHDLAYNEEYENAVMRVVNNPPKPDGIRIIPEDSAELPVPGVSVRADSISLQSLPLISEEELPLPLTDHRRIYMSNVPGIKLTHPGGYYEGGPGLDPAMDTFAEDFLARHPGASKPARLQAVRDQEIKEHTEDLQQRMRARQAALEHKERLERELNAMRETHALEMKVHRQQAERRKKKREEKERSQQAG